MGSQTLGNIKDSGPSPGAGHSFTNSQTLGGIKNSGPSPGAGHGFSNDQTLAGIKDSGPRRGKDRSFRQTWERTEAGSRAERILNYLSLGLNV
uniref:Uncharacterized protein n=1 Tax=Nelumbo nucifera TaxID=4432 RepID=A0A822XQJ0_NELNU|nr:TPA_asm: hypothetical protein HUJ06_022884 [Nelumbo nucifera]